MRIFWFARAVSSSLESGFQETMQGMNHAAVVIDKSFGTIAVLDCLHRLANSGVKAAPVVWGVGINESEALRLLQAGARGVLRRTSDPEMLVTCLRSVTTGNTWLEDGIFGDSDRMVNSALIAIDPCREHGLQNWWRRACATAISRETSGYRPVPSRFTSSTYSRKRCADGGLLLNRLRERDSFAANVLT